MFRSGQRPRRSDYQSLHHEKITASCCLHWSLKDLNWRSCFGYIRRILCSISAEILETETIQSPEPITHQPLLGKLPSSQPLNLKESLLETPTQNQPQSEALTRQKPLSEQPIGHQPLLEPPNRQKPLLELPIQRDPIDDSLKRDLDRLYREVLPKLESSQISRNQENPPNHREQLSRPLIGHQHIHEPLLERVQRESQIRQEHLSESPQQGDLWCFSPNPGSRWELPTLRERLDNPLIRDTVNQWELSGEEIMDQRIPPNHRGQFSATLIPPESIGESLFGQGALTCMPFTQQGARQVSPSRIVSMWEYPTEQVEFQWLSDPVFQNELSLRESLHESLPETLILPEIMRESQLARDSNVDSYRHFNRFEAPQESPIRRESMWNLPTRQEWFSDPIRLESTRRESLRETSPRPESIWEPLPGRESMLRQEHLWSPPTQMESTILEASTLRKNIIRKEPLRKGSNRWDAQTQRKTRSETVIRSEPMWEPLTQQERRWKSLQELSARRDTTQESMIL